jgi:hypothetical protein
MSVSLAELEGLVAITKDQVVNYAFILFAPDYL